MRFLNFFRLKIEAGWTVGVTFDEDKKQHPNLKGFRMLSEKDRSHLVKPVEENLKAMLAWGWTIEMDASRQASKGHIKRKMSKVSSVGYQFISVNCQELRYYSFFHLFQALLFILDLNHSAVSDLLMS